MKYTNETIRDGMILLTSCERFRIENVRPETGKCDLISLESGVSSSMNYPLNIVIQEVNESSTWKIEEQENYHIY